MPQVGGGGAMLSEPIGQVATGDIVSSLIEGGGGQRQGYQWVHGPSEHPFEPHEALDGAEFEGFDDPALANSTGFPPNAFYLPGDHWGCTCDFMPIWLGDEAQTDGSAPDLSDDQKYAVEQYSNNLARVLNLALRPGPLQDMADVDSRLPEGWDQKKLTSELDSAIQGAPKWKGGPLYRGFEDTRQSALDPRSMVKGFKWTEHSYMSTTDDPAVAQRFGSVVRIDMPDGVHALDMSEAGVRTDEAEWLLGRGHTVEITGPATTENGVSVIPARLIPHK